MKGLPILSCSECKFRLTTPYPTNDGWERAEYWWCTHPESRENKAIDEEGEERRKLLKGGSRSKVISYIAGYVEWTDKIEIPEFCPLPYIKE